MKWLFVSLLMLAHVFSISPPMPIQGSSSLNVGSRCIENSIAEEFSICIKNYPANWGMGSASFKGICKKTGLNKGFVTLFPSGGGDGCKITFESYADQSVLEKAFKSQRNLCSQYGMQPLPDGFWIQLNSGWYACRIQETYLIETWYMLSKPELTSSEKKKLKKKYDKKKYEQKKNEKLNEKMQSSMRDHLPIWHQLKSCVSIKREVTSEPIATAEIPVAAKQEPAPVVSTPPTPSNNVVFAHPSKSLEVVFNLDNIKYSLNEDSAMSYLLGFEKALTDHQLLQSLFYISWDPAALTSKTPYEEHLEMILADIKKLQPAQTMEGDPSVHTEQGFAVWKGNPFSLITLRGKSFLYAFATQLVWSGEGDPPTGFDFNSLIQRVSVKD